MSSTEAPKITPADAGTWLDGSQGWHNTYRVIERAFGYGWKPEDNREDIEKAVELYSTGQDGDTRTLADGSTLTYEDAAGWIIDQAGLSDAATEYLQSIAPEGYEFVWDAGELSLMQEDEADELGYLG